MRNERGIKSIRVRQGRTKSAGWNQALDCNIKMLCTMQKGEGCCATEGTITAAILKEEPEDGEKRNTKAGEVEGKLLEKRGKYQ